MAAIKLTFIVDDIDDVLGVPYDQIKVYRSTTGESGAFTELTVPSTRIALVAGTTVYEFTDTNGDADFWYTITYFHSTSLLESSQSTPIPGVEDPALSIISIEEVKTIYLWGIDLTDDDGNPIPDSAYRHYIRSAVSWVEAKLDIKLTPTVIDEEAHDFFRQDYYKYLWIKLDEVPIISVEQIRLVLPTETEVIVFQDDWIRVNQPAGQITIIPGNGQLAIIALGQTGAWLPMIYNWADFIPDVFRIQYTAGFPKGGVPAVLKDLVGKMASFGPLNIAGDLLGGAGIASQSISLDGLSQSFNTTSSSTNAGYGARLLQYTKEIKEVVPQLRRTFHPITLEAA